MTAAQPQFCPAPVRARFAGKEIRFACELAYDHAGDHRAAGIEWRVDPRTGKPTITKRLTNRM